MKYLVTFMLALGILSFSVRPVIDKKSNDKIMTDTKTASSFYNFKVETLDGETFDFSDLKGKRVLIVNTASKCGFTPQYEGLQKLYEQYGGEDFTVIGFPSNSFFQEKGEDEKIAEFCEKNYGVSFPMMSKIKVKGSGKHPVYDWLTKKDLNGVKNASVSWNFNKFLVDEDGNWVAHYGSRTKPMDEEILAFAKGE